MTEVVVTTGAISRAKLQSNHRHQQINTQFFTGRMPFLSLTNSVNCTEGNLSSLIWSIKIWTGAKNLCCVSQKVKSYKTGHCFALKKNISRRRDWAPGGGGGGQLPTRIAASARAVVRPLHPSSYTCDVEDFALIITAWRCCAAECALWQFCRL